MAQEAKFSKRMRDELRAQFGFEFYRVESHSTSPGIPDVFWIHTASGATGWLETKHTEKTPRKVAYRPFQAPWLQMYAKQGGRSCTLIHVASLDMIIFVPGRESVAAAAALRDSLGYRTVAMGREGSWKELAKLVLSS